MAGQLESVTSTALLNVGSMARGAEGLTWGSWGVQGRRVLLLPSTRPARARTRAAPPPRVYIGYVIKVSVLVALLFYGAQTVENVCMFVIVIVKGSTTREEKGKKYRNKSYK